MKKSTLYLVVTVSLLSCKIEPAEISYGNDACHYCSMTIVDKGHSSQYVTKKGKAYKFDAIECMVNELKEVDNSKIELLLVADFNNPGQQKVQSQ